MGKASVQIEKAESRFAASGSEEFVAEWIEKLLKHEAAMMFPKEKKGGELRLGERIAVPLNDGRTAEFVMTEEGDDHFRFDSRDCVGRSVWNDDDETAGGYPLSKIKEYADGELWELLPDELRAEIIPAKRKFLVGGETVETECMVFLPAAAEIFDGNECYGDEGLYSQMDYYKDRRNRMKGGDYGEDTVWYWTQSVSCGNSACSCNANYHGSAANDYASYAYGVPLCFLVKKSAIEKISRLYAASPEGGRR